MPERAKTKGEAILERGQTPLRKIPEVDLRALWDGIMRFIEATGEAAASVPPLVPPPFPVGSTRDALSSRFVDWWNSPADSRDLDGGDELERRSRQDAALRNAARRSMARGRTWREAESPRDAGIVTEANAEGFLREPISWGDPARVAQLQRELVQSGALTGDFQYGKYDAPTRKAYEEIVTFALEGEMTRWDAVREWDAARQWAEGQGIPWYGEGSGGGSGRRFVAPAFEAPDPAQLRQDIKKLFRERVGRDPEAGELERYAAGLAAGERASFDSQVQAARQEFEAQGTGGGGRSTAEQVLLGPSAGTPGTGEAGSVQAVNPFAQIIERFEQEFADEISVGQQVEEGQAGRQAVRATGANVSRLTGGL